MPFSAEAVANEFLQLAYRDHKTISPLKMQKLVYFAHGWYLAITGRPLLSEPIQAWQYGPVIPTLYRQFKEWGADPIRFPATKEVPGKGTIRPKLDDEGSPEEVETARKVIERVWKQYGRLSAAKLTALTHSENTPWARLPDKEEPGTVIPDEDIRDYFVRLAKAG